jgi:hypothetical protein
VVESGVVDGDGGVVFPGIVDRTPEIGEVIFKRAIVVGEQHAEVDDGAAVEEVVVVEEEYVVQGQRPVSVVVDRPAAR